MLFLCVVVMKFFLFSFFVFSSFVHIESDLNCYCRLRVGPSVGKRRGKAEVGKRVYRSVRLRVFPSVMSTVCMAICICATQLFSFFSFFFKLCLNSSHVVDIPVDSQWSEPARAMTVRPGIDQSTG